MDLENTLVEGTSETPNSEKQQPSSSKAGRPPPIILTSAINLIQLQWHIRDIVKGDFEFCNTRSGTIITTNEMEDFSAIRKNLAGKNLSYYTFVHKSEKPINSVIRRLLLNTPAHYISDGLMDLDFTLLVSRK
jgi:hypothetical protein